MSPKSVKKPAPKVAAVTSIPTKSITAKTEQNKAPKKTAKETYSPLAKDAGAAIPVDVLVEGDSGASKTLKTGICSQTVKLSAPSAFTVVKSIVLPEGHEYEGFQAIIVRPAKAFPFAKLSAEIRNRIYTYYFAANGTVGASVVIDGKRAPSKEPYARAYAEGSKYRVGLLAASIPIYREASGIFHALPINVDNTGILLDFLLNNDSVIKNLRSVVIKNMVKSSARNLFNYLVNAPRLTKVYIANGLFAEGDPAKAAKMVHQDLGKFLDGMAAARNGDKNAAIGVLRFGPKALLCKNGQDDPRPWPDTMVAEFRRLLEAKMK